MELVEVIQEAKGYASVLDLFLAHVKKIAPSLTLFDLNMMSMRTIAEKEEQFSRVLCIRGPKPFKNMLGVTSEATLDNSYLVFHEIINADGDSL